MQKKNVALAVGAALILQALASNIFFVGYFIDDANYILLARSWPALILGRAAPYDVSLADRFPAFAILLSPLAALLSPASPGLRVFSLGATALAGYLLAGLETKRLESRWALLSVCAFVFNSTVVRYAGTVMSEPIFMASGLLCAFLLCERPRREGLAVAALALTCVLRPQGVLFLAAATVAGLDREARARTARTAGAAFALYLLALAAIHLNAGRSISYFRDILHDSRAIAFLPSYLSGLKTYLGMAFPGAFFEWPPAGNALLRRAEAWTAIALGAGLMIRGAARYWEDRFTRICALYVLLSFAALPVWPLRDPRYVLALIPFIAMLFVRGLASLPPTSKAARAAVVAAVALLAACHLHGDARNLRDSFAPEQAFRAPARTVDFINDELGPNARIMALAAATFQLYTTHPFLRIVQVATREEFLADLRRRRITHVLLAERSRDQEAPGSSSADAQSHVEGWVKGSPLFRQVFEDAPEDVRIYAFADDPR
jgi:hypothetical protein